MKKKKMEIIIALLLIILAVVAFFVLRKHPEGIQEGENNPSNQENVVDQNKYLMQEETVFYCARILESTTKDYLTLFIETNIFEGEKVFHITYDKTKYTLETANPLLEGIPIQKGETTHSFEVSLAALENESMIFIKKNQNVVADKEDISIQLLEKEKTAEFNEM